jgi:hypothetical protein
MYFQWDNYHLKPYNPVRIMVAFVGPPLRGNVSFVNVIWACQGSSTVPVTLELFNRYRQSKELASHSGVS